MSNMEMETHEIYSNRLLDLSDDDYFQIGRDGDSRYLDYLLSNPNNYDIIEWGLIINGAASVGNIRMLNHILYVQRGHDDSLNWNPALVQVALNNDMRLYDWLNLHDFPNLEWTGEIIDAAIERGYTNLVVRWTRDHISRQAYLIAQYAMAQGQDEIAYRLKDAGLLSQEDLQYLGIEDDDVVTEITDADLEEEDYDV